MSAETSSVELVDEDTTANIARAALVAALTGAFAYVAFPHPFSPGPVTLQVLGVFLAGIFLGPIWGAASMVLYLTAGAIGAPVFAGGESSVATLVGPTAGYLWSYPIAAAAIGAIVHGGLETRDPAEIALNRLVGALTLGTAIIYAFGIAGFVVVLGLSQAEAALLGGVVFLPFEALKIAAAVAIVRSRRIVT